MEKTSWFLPTDSTLARLTGALFIAAWVVSALPARAQTIPLIPAGAVWKYSDVGADLGTAWRAPGYNDGAWPSGPAKLGYGDPDVATLVNSGPPTNRYITTYFRRSFVGAPGIGWSNLTLRLLRDDGAVVYLNGTEVRRDNMPVGPVYANTLATAAVGGADESTFFSSQLPLGVIVPGTNVMAVEVHQVDATSSDLSFNLELFARGGTNVPTLPVILAQPASQSVAAGSTVTFTVTASGAAPLSYQWRKDGVNLTNSPHLSSVTTATLTISNVQTPDSGNYAVVVSNPGGSVTSAEALLTIVPTPTLGAALDATHLVWTTGGDAPWVGQTRVTHDGMDAAETRLTDPETQSWLQTTVQGPGQLTFLWKTYCNGDFDLYRFLVDGQEAAVIWAEYEMPWQPRSFEIPAGIHTLRWVYEAHSPQAPHYGAWLDQVGFGDGGATPSLAEALDTPNLAWTTGGDSRWFGQTAITYDGMDAAQTGSVADFQECWLETRVALVAPGSVGFWWKASSGAGEFGLAFYTNGVMAGANIDGEVDWHLRTVALPPGEHLLRWAFHNTVEGDEGATAGWVDQVFITGLAQPPFITAQPESLTRLVGQDATFSVEAAGVPPLTYQWQKNGVDLAPQTNATLRLVSVQESDAGRYRVLISSPYGTTTSSESILTVLPGTGDPACAGSLDPTFDAGRGQWPPLWPPWAPTPITSVTVQADGRVVIAGGFSEVQGVPSAGIARLDATGLIESNYVANPADVLSHQRAVQPDGRVLVISPGDFESPGTLVRYQANGALDLSYAPVLPPGFNARAVLLQSDGKALVAGGVHRRDPETYAQTVTSPVARLLADGTMDSGFVTNVTLGLLPGEGAEAVVAVYDIVQQADGRIYLGGFFTAVNGVRRTDLARLHADGSLDSSFEPDIEVRTGADSSDVETVSALGLAPDGKLVIAGFLHQINGVERWAVARLHTTHDCSPCVDAPAGLVSWWRGEGNRVDEVGGNSGTLSGNATFGAGRVGQAFAFDGSSYVEVPDAPSLRLESELTIEFWVRRERFDQPHYIVEKGGDWTWGEQNYAVALHTGAYDYCLHFLFAGGWRGGGSIADTNWHHCAAVARDGEADPVLYIDGVQQSVVYGEGADTIRLNPSTRPLHIGAQIDPQSGWFYYHQGMLDELGIYNRALSAEEIEAVYRAGGYGKCATSAPPTIVVQPESRAVNIGADVTFSVSATGTPPLRFQWRFNAQTVPGATNATLVLQNVQLTYAGGYSVIVSNAAGVALSSNATLTVTPVSFVHRHIAGPTVQLVAAPASGVSVYAIEDQPPANWHVSDLSHGGVFDGATGRVKFGPFYDHEPRTLSYAVLPPPGAHGVFTFTGTASADGVNRPIVGDDRIALPWPHPADLQSPERSLGIGEVTAYGAAWRRGETWPEPPVPIPMDYVTRAGFLWRGGECYTVDNHVTNAPLWWVNCDAPPSPGFQSAVSQVSDLPAAQRQIPNAFVPGEPLTVAITARPPAGTHAYAIEDSIPLGWAISNITGYGEADPVNNKVKWGPFLDDTARTLSYQLCPPLNATGTAWFAGVVSFDGSSAGLAGPQELRVSSRLGIAARAGIDRLAFSLSGELGRRYVIEASRDLATWTPVLTVTNTTGRLEFAEPEPGRLTECFFRARLSE